MYVQMYVYVYICMYDVGDGDADKRCRRRHPILWRLMMTEMCV